jgi:hypothetical protein
MAYFNHAFNKVFVGTNRFVTTAIATQDLLPGDVGFMNPNPPPRLTPGSDNFTLTLAQISGSACPLVLVAGSIYQNDKIGPFHGGYQETTKSKIINPKYVSKFYVVPPCDLQQATISVGVTDDPDTDPEETPSCAKDFICGNNYYLRVDLKGSPALRFLSRNSYFTAMAYTGCCPTLAEGETAPAVDPTTVYIAWANQLMQSPLIAPFIQIAIFDTSGSPGAGAVVDGVGYNQETYNAAIRAGAPAWSGYTSPAGPYEGLSAGMMITGAYVDTQFGNCTFYPNDALQAYLEPVKIYASEVDYNGDPCAFTGLCVLNSCPAIQGSGYGEAIVRELILSEAYNQSPFYTGRDLRIREITQGYDVTNSIARIEPGNKYYRYFIQHSVPRFNNPTGTFDNDQYLLEIITSAPIAPLTIGAIETWLDNAGSTCVTPMEVLYACPGDCSVTVPPVTPAP